MRFRANPEAAWVDAETRNIGVGGAFIASELSHTVGTTIHLELVLPTNERWFQLPAIVRWVSTSGDDIGMGVQFVDVDVDILLELNDYFSTLTGQL